MPRNGSGSYSLPEAPFVPLTTISSAAVNSDLSDIGTALTGSLARDGQGGMTAVLPLNTTGFTYTNDTNTGMYRTGSDAQAIKCGGTDVVAVTASGASVTGTLSATTIQQNGITLLPVGLGPLPWSGSYAPSGWVLANGQTLSRTTYAALWAFAQSEITIGNVLYTNGDGTTTFTVPDLRCRLPFGRDNMGGAGTTNRITSAYFGSAPNIIGNTGGTESKTLTQANLPNVAPALNGTPANLQFAAGAGVLISSGFTASIGGGASALLGVVGTPSLPTYTPSGTVSINGGVTQTAVSAIPPGIIVSYIIFAGV